MAKRLTAEQVGAAWLFAVSKNQDSKAIDATADAISQAFVESGFDPRAVSSANYKGLWQDTTTDPKAFDPLHNAELAYAKWKDGGGSFVKHWTHFQGPGTEAKRLAYLPRAKVAAARVKKKGGCEGGQCLDMKALEKLVSKAGGDTSGRPLSLGGPLGAAADAPGDIGDAIAQVLKPVGDFFKIIADPATWARVGKVLLGAIIVLFAINQISNAAVPSARRAGRKAWGSV